MGFVLETPPGDVAFAIALGVLLLTVVLEPVVRFCVHRARAARAWRSIKNHEAVDITKVREHLWDRRVGLVFKLFGSTYRTKRTG